MGEMADMHDYGLDLYDIDYYKSKEIPKNKRKMKTSKIKTVVEIKSHTNDYGETFYHNLEMENGDKINIGKKKEQLVGWELTYEVTGEGQEYNKAKSVQQENFTPAVKQVHNDNLKGVKIGHAITNAVSLHCALGSIKGDDHIELSSKDSIKEYAKMIYQISEELNTEI